MSNLLKNLYRAPKSTILALVLLTALTLLKHYQVIETETYGTLCTLIIPLGFTDLLRERKAVE